jgi:hypothetical protein
MHAILATVLGIAGTALSAAGIAAAWSVIAASRIRVSGVATVDGWDSAMPILLLVLGIVSWAVSWLVWEARPRARRPVSRGLRQRFRGDRRP